MVTKVKASRPNPAATQTTKRVRAGAPEPQRSKYEGGGRTHRDAVKTPVAQAIEPQFTPEELEVVQASRWAQFSNKDAVLLFLFGKRPEETWMRTIVCNIAQFCAGLGVTTAGFYLTDLLVMGALTLTSSAWLALALLVIGLITSMYVGWKAGCVAFNYVLSRDADRHWSALVARFTPGAAHA